MNTISFEFEVQHKTINFVIKYQLDICEDNLSNQSKIKNQKNFNGSSIPKPNYYEK